MSTLLNRGFGLEELGTELWLNLQTNLNTKIQEVATSADKVDLDRRVDEARGIDTDALDWTATVIEPVATENLHLHNSPSVINPENEPLESFPSVSVVAYRTSPSVGDAEFDQFEEYTDLLYVELLVKASPEDGAEVCGKRAYRTADAIHLSVNQDRTLAQRIFDIGGAPQLLVSEVFLKPENDYGGPDWYWQAARIDYTLDKTSPIG